MFNINSNLRESIFSVMPQDYTDLEKAVFIYSQLCKKLNYSMQFFLEEDKYMSYYTAVENLADIDGIKRSDVVCFTFNAIYGQLLVDAGIISEEVLQLQGMLGTGSETKFHSIHNDFRFPLGDGLVFYCDSTLGIFDNNDLVNSKYTPTLKGWGVEIDYDIEDPHERQEKYQKGKEMLDKAIEKITSKTRQLAQFESEYLKLKGEDKSLLELPLEERRDLFLQMATSREAPDYSILTFNYFLKLKHILFKREELEYDVNKNAELVFVKDKLDGQYKCLFAFNKDGYTNDRGYEDFDSLEIYEISPASRSIKQIAQSEFASYREKHYIDQFKKMKSQPKMLTEGKVYLTEVYEGGKAVYDSQQKATNVVGYLRRLIEEDRMVESDAEGNILE